MNGGKYIHIRRQYIYLTGGKTIVILLCLQAHAPKKMYSGKLKAIMQRRCQKQKEEAQTGQDMHETILSGQGESCSSEETNLGL